MKDKEFKITFKDNFKGKSAEDCYGKLLDYLQKCVVNGDVTAFNFKEIKSLKPQAKSWTTIDSKGDTTIWYSEKHDSD